MPSLRAAASAFSCDREAMATICDRLDRCIAGITFSIAILAAPSTPQRSLPVDKRSSSNKVLNFGGSLMGVSPPKLRRPKIPHGLVVSDHLRAEGLNENK